MATEVDAFLIQNFHDGFRECDGRSKDPLYKHFQQIGEKLNNILGYLSSPSSDAEKEAIRLRETLYIIKDAWSEWQKNPKGKLLSNKVTGILKELGEIQKACENGNGSTSQQPNGEASSSMENKARRWSSRSVETSKVYGFEVDVIKLQRVLLSKGSDDVLKAIGIVGIAGIGKTTLCRSLVNSKEVKDYFFPTIWVSMARQPDEDTDEKVAMVRRMLLCLGVEQIIQEADERNLKELLNALHRQLLGKRYLIVFDDARDTDKWYEELNSLPSRSGNGERLAYGLPKGYGGAVIVTSRNEELAKKMIDPRVVLHRVQPLSDPSWCWNIFIDAAKEWSDSSDEQLKKEFFNRCAGHPLTAKMMGEIFWRKLEKESQSEIPRENAEAAAQNSSPHPVSEDAP